MAVKNMVNNNQNGFLPQASSYTVGWWPSCKPVLNPIVLPSQDDDDDTTMMNDYDYDEDYGTAADDHDWVAKLFSTLLYFLYKEEKIKWWW